MILSIYRKPPWLVSGGFRTLMDHTVSRQGFQGTGRSVVPLSQDKKVFLSRCPFVPGQKKFPCHAVPLSRDKRSSKNTGTRWFVPGRPAGQNGLFLPINDVSEERKHDFYTENRINGQNKTPFGTHFGTPNAGLVIQTGSTADFTSVQRLQRAALPSHIKSMFENSVFSID